MIECAENSFYQSLPIGQKFVQRVPACEPLGFLGRATETCSIRTRFVSPTALEVFCIIHSDEEVHGRPYEAVEPAFHSSLTSGFGRHKLKRIRR